MVGTSGGWAALGMSVFSRLGNQSTFKVTFEADYDGKDCRMLGDKTPVIDVLGVGTQAAAHLSD